MITTPPANENAVITIN